MPLPLLLLLQVVMWLGAAVSALAATRACLQWEPLVVPPMPGQPPTPPLPPMASVNLTTVGAVGLVCGVFLDLGNVCLIVRGMPTEL